MARQKPTNERPLTETLIVSSSVGAAFLGVSSRWVQQLATDGWVKPVGRGKWNLAELVQGYAASMKDEDRRSSRQSAENRVREARAAEIERRMAREDRKIIDIDEAFGVLDNVIGQFLQSISGLPAQITRNVGERRRIEAICDAERQRLSTQFAEGLSALETGIPTPDPADEDE